MPPAARRGDPATWRTREQARPHQERLADLLDRVRLLTDGYCECRQPDGTSTEGGDQRPQHRLVQPVEPDLVDVVHLQRRPGGVEGHHAVTAYLGEVPYATQQPVGDAGGAPGPAG